MVFIKMLQTKTAINASRAMRNDFIWPKFLFKSNTMQLCLSNYTIPRVVQLQTIVLYCRRNARFPVHTSPPRKFSECAVRFLILILPDFKLCLINFVYLFLRPPVLLLSGHSSCYALSRIFILIPELSIVTYPFRVFTYFRALSHTSPELSFAPQLSAVHLYNCQSFPPGIFILWLPRGLL